MAVFDHSWQLLSAPERAAFMKLSVFRDGFDRQAAEQVAGATLATLATLVKKSLLYVVTPGRYDMLEPLKQYAATKLAESAVPTVSEIQDRHGRYYLFFLQSREKQLQGGGQSQALEEINAAFQNIQVAWRWAVDYSQLDLVEQVCRSLFLYFDIRCRFQTGDALFTYAISPLENLSEGGDSLENRVLGMLLACRGRLLHNRGEFQASRAVLEKSLHICHTCNHPKWAAFTLHSLSLVAAAQGEGQQAKQFAQESLVLCQYSNSQWDEAWALFALGSAAYFLGEYTPGWAFIEKSLVLHRQLGNQHGEAACLNKLGLIICGQYEGDPEKYSEAREFFEQNLAIRQTIGDRWGEATALHNVGYINFKLQRYDRAKARFEASLKISKTIDSLAMMAATGMWMGMLALEQENYLEAKCHLVDALKIAYENDALTRLTDVLCRIGDLLRRTGQFATAVEYLAFVQHHSATDDRVRLEAKVLLEKLAAVLPSEVMEAARATGRARTLEGLVADVLEQS
jgi:tetratricopeptide (TPR) repeat protein